ncbi:F-box associated interaction domain-containing protein [Artemisia annua]|uniref:F-box associated interaction domain-containing protein n=1 Tax=Artemisia annua TaxID=35608 RepID=A0A2U1MA24_ARTAN|nr:F-box associated interaction domain-containing protein [Artemisia annua]
MPLNFILRSCYPNKFTFRVSCNGLVCVSTHNWDVDKNTLVILNPTTRDFVEFPDCSIQMINNPWNIYYRLYGFGYDCLTDDYKVVVIRYSQLHELFLPDSMCVHVFCLRNNTWRPKDSQGLPVIFAFSLADELFNEVPSTSLCYDVDIMSNSDCILAALGEKLAIYLAVKGEVWLMNEYGVTESWTKNVPSNEEIWCCRTMFQ